MCREAGDEGWWGTWAEMVFNVSRTQPFITTPREVARLEYSAICQRPVMIQNQFYEYLQFGNGKVPKFRWPSSCKVQGYSRNNVPTFTDLAPAPQLLHIYTSNSDDVDNEKHVLIQGIDSNGQTITSQDDGDLVQGIYLTLDTPFIATPMALNAITGIQKDITVGSIQIFQADPTTGNEVLLLTMEPSEQVASYRRYYFDNLPISCCPPIIAPAPVPATLQVTALAKLEFIPVMVDSDYLLIQSTEAIISECESIRYGSMDVPIAKQMSQAKHTEAIRMLQGQLVHYLGKDLPAINFAPFGSARLEKQKIGTMI